jgi:16S rRNA (adenine1518-N6/adenine1519-N6)-dimethyltransferase
MASINYHSLIKGLNTHKSLGQNFLLNRDIAELEANYAKGMSVVELGPGVGILTEALCRKAKRVTAIERDPRLCEIITENIKSENLHLINADFFLVDPDSLGKIDIMVSNIPYNLSSKVIYWLSSKHIPALLCVQKEFAEHMIAVPGTRNYSKLSVISSLRFAVHHIKNVPAGNFFPKPRVDSSIIYLAPKRHSLDDRDVEIISLLMNHKKKRVRNAVIDSSDALLLKKEEARELADNIRDSDERPFKISPEGILAIAQEIKSKIQKE